MNVTRRHFVSKVKPKRSECQNLLPESRVELGGCEHLARTLLQHILLCYFMLVMRFIKINQVIMILFSRKNIFKHIEYYILDYINRKCIFKHIK